MTTACIQNGTKVHNQGNDGICYAFAAATNIRNFQHNKRNNPLDHQQLVKRILQNKQLRTGKDSRNGGFPQQQIKQILQKDYPGQYTVKYLNSQETSNDLKMGKTPIIQFYLTDNQWNQFFSKFKQDPKAKFLIKNPSNGDKSQLSGHACCIISQTSEYFVVKNSWGSSWGDRGYFRLYKNSINYNVVSTSPLNPNSIQQGRLNYLKVEKQTPKYEGKIKYGHRYENNTYMAAKDKKQHNQLIKQQTDLVGLKHKNINQVKDIFFDATRQQHVIVSNNYDKSLKDRYKQQKLSGIQKAYITRDCLNGLTALEKIDRNHGDLHQGNIVFDLNSKTAKLNDFDFSKKFARQQQREYMQAKKQDTKKLKNVMTSSRYDKSDVNKQVQQIRKVLDKNKGNHLKAKKQIEQQIILKEYKNKAKFQLGINACTSVANTVNAMGKDIYQNGLTQKTLKIGAKQISKGAVGVGVKAISQTYTKKKILQSVNNQNYKIGLKKEVGFMAIAQLGKQLVNVAFTDKDQKYGSKQAIKSVSNIGLNIAEYVVTKKTTEVLEKKILGKAIQKITNYSASTVSSTVGKSTINATIESTVKQTSKQVFKNTLLSTAKTNAIGCAVGCVMGIVFDVARGDNVIQSVKRNLKSSAGSFIGSTIGAAIGSVVPFVGTAIGGFIGGLLGGILSSWF